MPRKPEVNMEIANPIYDVVTNEFKKMTRTIDMQKEYLIESEKALAEKEKALIEKDRALEEKEKIIRELRQRLEST
ncbi:MAG TPA: hypothetical protein VK469_15290 [Candidatus Kapabacteria bacterium]|nr:hypothetical protein [Candidatus Kapabacteria bacterium]